jgi:hypothetical protein
MLVRTLAIWMLLAATALAAHPPMEGEPPYGWMWPEGRGPVPYEPREGDIVLLTSKAPFQTSLYFLARSGHPVHSGVVVKRYDGRLAFLEVGGGGDWRVTLKPLYPRLAKHMEDYEKPVIWIRRIKRELKPHESLRLTHFANSQLYKRFSTDARLAAFVLPLRPGPPTTLDQEQWFCSELLIAALQYTHLVDEEVRPGGITPHDLYYDTRIDLRYLWGLPYEWNAKPVFPSDRTLISPLPRY